MEHENLGVTGPMNGDIAKNIPLVENGFMYPTENPVLGLDLNEALLGKYAFKDLIQVIE
ncbi:MAG TPA: hypothetical protein PLL36_04865 [Candidatus Hydrogenedentes bacterium]|jgi:L-alanine-DL-glutamate epimerase-like enolase superfamily enzyme|nr:hypothetical protein [Candidatus Hydrogenedentota bacterium]